MPKIVPTHRAIAKSLQILHKTKLEINQIITRSGTNDQIEGLNAVYSDIGQIITRIEANAAINRYSDDDLENSLELINLARTRINSYIRNKTNNSRPSSIENSSEDEDPDNIHNLPTASTTPEVSNHSNSFAVFVHSIINSASNFFNYFFSHLSRAGINSENNHQRENSHDNEQALFSSVTYNNQETGHPLNNASLTGLTTDNNHHYLASTLGSGVIM